MQPFESYPVLAEILHPLRRSQQTTLSWILAAILEAGTGRTLAIATKLALWLETRLDSALNRLYRALRNPRIDWLSVEREFLRLLGRTVGRRLLIAIDWTEWHGQMRMLVASVVLGRRAVAVQTEAFERQKICRSQNARENTFLRTLGAVLREAGLEAVILCDRGFRRVSWLSLLLELGLSFVVRLKDDVTVHSEHLGGPTTLGKVGLSPGRAVDLGWVRLRSDEKVEVRVVGAWASGAREPWWLATNLRREAASTVVSYYDRRMAVEEQLRDQKGSRFGLELCWTNFRKPDHLGRFARLTGIALFIWMGAGVAAAQARPSLRLPHPTKGPRLSYVRIGIQTLHALRGQVELTGAYLAALLPRPAIRRFAWISSAIGPPAPPTQN